VRTIGGATIYYPFHTPRGRYNNLTGPSVLDSNGGSWLGKKVMQFSDGTFLFDNLWQDTVVIKPQAVVGDSWVMYNDTTKRFYRASIVAADTMTVAGFVDSIKTINITAYDDTGYVPADPVNNFKIILSKNNGFVQVIDLYTFPYHAPDSIYTQGFDYYLDLISREAGSGPAPGNSEFSLVSFINPTNEQMTNWNTGDVFENSVFNISYPGSGIYPYQYYFDSITDKTIVAGGIQYTYTGWLATQHFPPFAYVENTNYPYDTVSVVSTFTINNTLFADTTFMPEEYLQPLVQYYFPADSSHCSSGPLYKYAQCSIVGNEYEDIFFESSGIQRTYKMGLGLINYHLYTIGNPDEEIEDTTLLYYTKAGHACGTYITPQIATAVPGIMLKKSSVSVFPNPASEELTVSTNYTQPYTIAIYNMMWQVIRIISSIREQETISIKDLPEGVYNICISSEVGDHINNKVVIVH